MIFAQEIGLTLVFLEGDSKVIINSLRNKENSFASFSHLIGDAEILTCYDKHVTNSQVFMYMMIK